METDTIVAISTPTGEGGIGIVRLSGPQAIDILTEIFYPHKADISIPTLSSHRVVYGFALDKRTSPPEMVDEVLTVIYRKPRSYTKEDIVEISGHGGIVPLTRILNLCLAYGARLAKPGEFTYRAFINGRIDLVQAESVCDLIRSRTEKSAKLTIPFLAGTLSRKVKLWQELLIDLLTQIEVSLDHSEEEIEFISIPKKIAILDTLIQQMTELSDTAAYGKIFRDGLRTVIIGKPNVGKSSLFNLLIRQDRAIVTDIAGTTRDLIEVELNLNGILIILFDTAGLPKVTDHPVEILGVEKTKQSLELADLVLWVINSSEPITEEDRSIGTYLTGKKVIVVYNKIDLPERADLDDLYQMTPNLKIVKLSAKTGLHLPALERAIIEQVQTGQSESSPELVLTNVRHQYLLQTVGKVLSETKYMVEKSLPDELVSINLRTAIDTLGEIIGTTVAPDIIDGIFHRFCLGK